MPNEVISPADTDSLSIFENEINAKNEEAKKELKKLVGGNAESFVKGNAGIENRLAVSD